MPTCASVLSSCARNCGCIPSGNRSKCAWKFFAQVTPFRWVHASEDGLTMPEDCSGSHASVSALGRPDSPPKSGCRVKWGSPSVNAANVRFGFRMGGPSSPAASSIAGSRRSLSCAIWSFRGNGTPLPLIAMFVDMLYSEYQ
ncbi:hypothetical protein [Haloarcula regularis]|uniref:hypothetical protein n=1 Tax=Haloarcula regularis TaxID=3033392 RepID=UPI0023E838B5|nr:hypothetical protein [Halomicroarcula sp. SYNS111]